MKVGLYIGRFQPFHLGHLSVIKDALKQVDRIMIGLGSSQEGRTKKNPFTAKERSKMIKAALKEAKISPRKYKLVLLKDILECDEVWVKYVLKKIGRFQILWTGNPWMKRCFKDVKSVKLKNVKKEVDVSSTKIRRLLKGKGWERLVPKSVSKEIKRMKRFI
ncbi:nicotinamide-nucleotide adenylyltransferase [Candidatus Woesearchaeota archaeon]|nr:nicotinamide-nucleotide adenylyltransferase [Candidatus Woesearchaeota archaeon]